MNKLAEKALPVILALSLTGQAAAQGLKSYEPLKDPQISTRPAQKMLVADCKGDPGVAAQVAIATLYRTFYALPGAKLAAPRGRWAAPFAAPKADWAGILGLPIPDDIKSLPAGAKDVRIETWAYGEVAEILHVGSYDSEQPTVERLMKFIADKGYVVAGPHEEEYLAGPGMVAEPVKYQTIIRYQVKKK
jgi:hypothetical protein